MVRISVLLVDDNPVFLRVEKMFVEQYCQNEVVVVGVATSSEEALRQAQDLQPQLVLLDMEMPGMNDLQVIPHLKKILPQARIIMLALLDNHGYREAALAAGADDFVAKGSMSTDLLPAILRVMQPHR
ncbi:MAG: response regulator transcription factor [Chloroflexota bacterium]|nr:response regulator transcription factor [Chloroflexota bacterium]